VTPVQRLAWILWVGLLTGVTVRVAVSKPTSHTVVPIYLQAAKCMLAGTDAYASHPALGLDVYRNPPGFAVAFVPLTLLPEKVAGILWRWLGFALVVFGLRNLARDTLGLSPQQTAWLFVLAFPLTLSSFDNGQANLHLMGTMALGTAAVARRDWLWAGVWLALAVANKGYPLALVGLMALVHPRLIPRVLPAIALFVLYPFLVFPTEFMGDQFRQFAGDAQTDDRTHTLLFRVPRDWTLLARTWLDVVPELNVVRKISVVVGAMLAVVVAVTRPRAETVLILATVWMTLFGPATEAATYTLLAPGMALAMLTFQGRTRWVAQTAGVFLTSQVFRDLFPAGWKWGVLGPQPFGAALLLGATLVECVKQAARRKSTANETEHGYRRIPSRISGPTA
jgi:hypothetical protein